jgi:hypothetical protein
MCRRCEDSIASGPPDREGWPLGRCRRHTGGHPHRGRRAKGLPRRGCCAVHNQIRNQEIPKQKQKQQIHEYPTQNHQRKKKPRWGVAAPPHHAGERHHLAPALGPPREERAGEPGALARACVHRRGVPAAVAAATRGAAAPGCGCTWGPCRRREKGGRGRRRGCGHKGELGFEAGIYWAREWLRRRQQHRSSAIQRPKIILLPWPPPARVVSKRSLVFRCHLHGVLQLTICLPACRSYLPAPRLGSSEEYCT